ncbi:vascular cell adhesion protein 1-like isoform X1 [Oncorhynchus kisutch]|uniref:vascular cell adhesion protein 1-like isoform X1 n=1 Tax=Oncorhynchus kisutch TaxID=8019 RepID=UPI0012DEE48C|nr:vascular cell adhesion protein 1-like isoform X1 [Oncorhynchus kisutch]
MTTKGGCSRLRRSPHKKLLQQTYFDGDFITTPIRLTQSTPNNLDAECLVVSPARLVVKHGDPASSNCSSDTPVEMGWEATQGGAGLTDNKVKILNWKVDSLTDWNSKPTCFTEGGQCQKQLNITVYKLPDRVSISYRKYPDPMVEGHQYLLQCLVQNIAPIGRLRVTFYKVSATGEQTELDTQQKSKDNIKTPENGTYTLDFTPGRDDDGAQLLCSAMLDLGPEGPQPPPVMDSNRLNTNVHYKPQITSPGCFSMSITEGDTLSLNCSANGNPAPSYDWLLPHADPNTMEERSVVTITNMAKSHSGNYTCFARNPLGNSTCTVNVEVTDAECPVISPARLVVKYGDPASSNCSSDTPVEMGWEAIQGGTSLTDNKVKILNWRVNSVTEWNSKPTCFTEGGQCQKQLNITVYKLPDRVSISYRKYPDPMVEGHQYLLQCLVQNIAPIGRLRVTFYKVSATGEQTELDTQQKSKDNIKTPENGTYTLDFTPGRDDDGAQLLCSAMLDLGPEGPQPPPVMDSNRLNTNVHYKPQITSPGCFSMSITEGDTLSLNCSANGNPAPSYNWLLSHADPNTMEERSVVTITNMAKSHSGEYTCIARNPLGKSTCTVNVEVTVNYLPIIAGLTAAVVVILLVSCFIYSWPPHRAWFLSRFLPRFWPF